MRRFCLVGPTYPFRGGIAHYTTLLARQLEQSNQLLFISFTRQYPGWLYPGRSDRDPSNQTLTADAEYLLDPLSPLSWRRALKRIADFQPDVVVVPWWVPFWAPSWAVLGRKVKRLSSSPKLIYICHNVIPHERGLIDKMAARVALSPADGFLVHSEADASKLLELFPTARLKVTPLPSLGEVVAVFQSPIPVELPANKPVLLFFGFVRPYKGLDILIQALPEVLKKNEVHLLAAGEFWQGEEPYRRLVEELELSANVTILDRYLRNEELAACLNRADLVVLPYRSATQSAVIPLAYGLDKPVVTTDVGGLSEIVTHERTGLIVPPEDPMALAQAINRFFDEKLGPQFQANIRAEKDRFAWSTLVKVLDDLAQLDS